MEVDIPQPMEACATSPRPARPVPWPQAGLPAHLRDLLTRFYGHAQPGALSSLPMRGAIHLHIYTSTHPYTHTSLHPYIFTPLLPIPGCVYHNIGWVDMFPEYFFWLGGNEHTTAVGICTDVRYMTEGPVTLPYPPLGVVVYTARFL